MSKVVTMGGSAIASPGEPDEKVVGELKYLLERAESGVLTGLSYSVSYFDNTSTNRYVGEINRSQLGGLFLLMQRMAQELNDKR